MRRCIFTFAYFLIFTFASAQDSCRLRISLLTCSPGEELYSTFGHTALRVTDSVSNTDVVYNYGTFNFQEPGFYTKFTRGKLLYYLSTEDPGIFLEGIRQENRGVIEQVLNLTCTQKSAITAMLAENLLPQNRGYKYDFLFDNCTTRCRDLIEKVSGQKIKFPSVVPEGTRFRELIHDYLDSGDHQWSKLGIDLLLGKKTDAIMSNREAMFLPDYLMKSFDSTILEGHPLVSEKINLFKPVGSTARSYFTDPLVIFTILLILIIVLGFSKNPFIIRTLNAFDGFLLFMTGVCGVMILIMWFGTEHVMCRDNLNIIWAWPTHVVMAFFIHSRKLWVRKYFAFTLIICILVLLAWFFIPQQFNPAFIPMVLLMAWRSGMYLSQAISYGK